MLMVPTGSGGSSVAKLCFCFLFFFTKLESHHLKGVRKKGIDVKKKTHKQILFRKKKDQIKSNQSLFRRANKIEAKTINKRS